MTTAPHRATGMRDRRAEIGDAAAAAFGERGFDAVTMGDIATAVGISGPALYRYFPTKYAMFAHASLQEVEALLAAAQAVTEPRDPVQVLTAVAEVTVANRAHGSLYRWQSRMLQRADVDVLRSVIHDLRSTLRDPLCARRPELDQADATVLTQASLAVVASITAHRMTLTDALLEELVQAAVRVLGTDLPAAPDPTRRAPERPAPYSVREALMTHTVRVVNARGYQQATLEEVGARVGLVASGVYRYFPSKAAILRAAFQRATHQLTALSEDVLAEAPDPGEALGRLLATYTRFWFRHPEVMSVYFADAAALDESDREELRLAQRSHLDTWAGLLRQAEPGLAAAPARLRVMAALNVVADVGQLVRFDDRPQSRARVVAVAAAALRTPDRP